MLDLAERGIALDQLLQVVDLDVVGGADRAAMGLRAPLKRLADRLA